MRRCWSQTTWFTSYLQTCWVYSLGRIALSIPHSKVRVVIALLQGLGEGLAEPLSASTQQVFTVVVRVPCCFSEVIWNSNFVCVCVCVCVCVHLVAQSCLTLCNPMNCSPPGSSVHGASPGKSTGVGCHALRQGISPTQGLNPGLPHYMWILYHLNHEGSPWILEWGSLSLLQEIFPILTYTKSTCFLLICNLILFYSEKQIFKN